MTSYYEMEDKEEGDEDTNWRSLQKKRRGL